MARRENGVVRYSSVPHDLRSAGPSGEVERYWQPESFVWYGKDEKSEPYITFSKTMIVISNAAALQSKFKPGDRLLLGVNKAYLAVKKDDSGIPSRGESQRTKSVRISAAKLIKKLVSEGYPICRLPCQWDPKSQMLVAAWPKKDQSS